MSNIHYLDSVEVPELDLYVGNKEVHLLRYFEPEPGLFLAETHNVIMTALQQGYEPLSIVITRNRLEDPILSMVGDTPIYVVDGEKAKRHFGYTLTGGITCAMRRKNRKDDLSILEHAKRIVVLENVENPTNVGAIFRSAAALGIDAVVLSPSCADPFYRRAMRVSIANSLLIPWTYIGRNERDWQEKAMTILKEAGFKTAALALHEDNISIDDPILKEQEKLALIMGNEGEGLTSSTISACDYVAKIPMQEGVDSLNVAVAAGIAMWEIRK